jgi:proton-coupled amino acid transporter
MINDETFEPEESKEVAGEKVRDVASHELEIPKKSLSTNTQTFANIIKANIGSGILGMPFAFKSSGYLLGTIALVILGWLAIHNTILLIKCKKYLNKLRTLRNEKTESEEIITYGQVGKATFGPIGDIVISTFLIFTQCGFCCAYLIFICENLSDMTGLPHYKPLFIIITSLLMSPITIFRTLKHLAPFSMLSELALIVGMTIVCYFSIHHLVVTSEQTGFPGPTRNLRGVNWSTFPVFCGIAIFSFEGIGLALPIEHNMKNKKAYNLLLTMALFLIATLMGVFGLLGYFAYGMGVNSVITLNLPTDNALSMLIKIAFIISLFFTYPIQLYPVSQLLDQNFRYLRRFIRQQIERRSGTTPSHPEQDRETLQRP